MRAKKLFLNSAVWVLLGACMYGSVQAQTLTEVVQNALANYPALQAARAKTEAARSDIERTRAAHYPQIAYGFTRSKYSNTELPASTKQNMNTPSVKLNLWAGGRIEADAERAEALTFSSEQLEAVSRDDVAQQAGLHRTPRFHATSSGMDPRDVVRVRVHRLS